jgi:hypothetical protein
MKVYNTMFNWRMRVLYSKIDALKDPEYIKRKNSAKLILQALRKLYDGESKKVKEEIIDLSLSLREAYPEINGEFPVK